MDQADLRKVAAAGRPLRIFSVVFVVLALLSGISGAQVNALAFFATAALLFRGSQITRRSTTHTLLLQAAHQEITRGRFDLAEKIHAELPARMKGAMARFLCYQRGLIHFLRGDADAAIHALSPGVSERVGIYGYTLDHNQRAACLAVRALAYASKGDAESALRDVIACEPIAEAPPDAVARCALARAVVLSRNGASDELATFLAKNSSLMLERTLPRERALVRALRRMTRTNGRSVYREPAPPEQESAPDSELRKWVGMLSTEAAAHVENGIAGTGGALASPTMTASDEDRQVVAGQRRIAMTSAKTARNRQWAVAAGAIACFAVALLGLEALFSRAEPFGSGPAFPPSRVVLVAVAFFAGFFAWLMARARNYNRKSMAAQRAIALGDLERATALVTPLTRSTVPLGAAIAHIMMAQIAECRGDFEACIMECDRAFASIGRLHGAQTSATPAILPLGMGTRAVALAALGRSAEARSELAVLLAEHPSYAFGALFHFRVRLIDAIRNNDLDTAAAVARERNAELPIPLRDELLADIMLALTNPGTPGEEVGRIERELHEDDVARQWVDTIAPSARALLQALSARGRVRVTDSPPAVEEATQDATQGALLVSQNR